MNGIELGLLIFTAAVGAVNFAKLLSMSEIAEHSHAYGREIGRLRIDVATALAALPKPRKSRKAAP